MLYAQRVVSQQRGSTDCSAKVCIIEYYVLGDNNSYFANGVQMITSGGLITWIKQPFSITSRNVEGDKLLIVCKIILQYCETVLQ